VYGMEMAPLVYDMTEHMPEHMPPRLYSCNESPENHPVKPIIADL